MNSEMKARHSLQRRMIPLMSGGFLVAVLVLGIWMWQLSKVGSAQSTATPAPAKATPSGSVDNELAGRMEELSRSQDRLVDAVIGIITVTGAGFFILVGYSAFQANRNAERESAFIRDSAEIQITKAVGVAEARVEEIVQTAESTLVARTEEIAIRSQDAFQHLASRETRSITNVGMERENILREKADAAQALMDDAVAGFRSFFSVDSIEGAGGASVSTSGGRPGCSSCFG